MSVAIGILSTAHIHAEDYVEILKQLNGIDLIGVTDNEEERGAAFATEHGVEYLDQADLLDTADGVIVCSTNTTHGQWIRSAADADVDVLSEKPLATTDSEARTVANYCDDQDISLGVAMPLRHSVPVQRASHLLENDTIGEIRAISGTNRGKLPGSWFTDPNASGGGAVMDHTVHVVDLVHWLTGEYVEEVYAETATRFHDIPVEDVNMLSMELSDGTQFSLDGSWSKPDEWRFWGDLTLEFIGTDGAISVDCFDETFTETTRGASDGGVNSVFWGTDPNELMLLRFVEMVRDNKPPETSPEDGIAAVAVVEAAYESAEQSTPTTVDY